MRRRRRPRISATGVDQSGQPSPCQTKWTEQKPGNGFASPAREPCQPQGASLAPQEQFSTPGDGLCCILATSGPHTPFEPLYNLGELKSDAVIFNFRSFRYVLESPIWVLLVLEESLCLSNWSLKIQGPIIA